MLFIIFIILLLFISLILFFFFNFILNYFLNFDIDENADTEINKMKRISCMRVIQDSIWISIGSYIIITTFHDIFLNPHHSLKLHSSNGGAVSVSDICSYRDQVWCLCHQNGYIIEVDSGSYNVICYLSCCNNGCSLVEVDISDFYVTSQAIDKLNNQPLRSTVEQISNKIAQELRVCQEKNENILKSRQIKSLENETSTKYFTISNPGMSSSFSQSQFRRTKRKISMRRNIKKLISDRKSICTGVGNNQSKDVPETTSVQIRKIAYFKGVLWVGMVDGGMMLVNVNQHNLFNIEYGSLICKLKHYKDKNTERKAPDAITTTPDKVTIIPDMINDVNLSDMVVMGGTRDGDYEGVEGVVVTMVSCKLRRVPHRRAQTFVWRGLSLSDILTHQQVPLTIKSTKE